MRLSLSTKRTLKRIVYTPAIFELLLDPSLQAKEGHQADVPDETSNNTTAKMRFARQYAAKTKNSLAQHVVRDQPLRQIKIEANHSTERATPSSSPLS
ncbi:hypothetical protein ACSS6W_009675 [Trichoderma asperelloides]